MKDSEKSREQLVIELASLRRRVNELEKLVQNNDGVVEPVSWPSELPDLPSKRQAEEQLTQKARRYKLLSRAGERLLEVADPLKIIHELACEMMIELDCHTFFNFVADEGMGKLRLNAYSGIPAEEAAKIEWLDYGCAVCGCVARDGIRNVIENVQASYDPVTALIKTYGIRTYACHPLISQGRVLGTLSFGSRTKHRFSADDLEVMESTSRQVTLAMERLQVLEALQKSEVRFRRVFSNNMVPMAIWSKTCDIIDANDMFLQMLGYSRDEIESGAVSLHEITPSEYRKRDLQAIADIEAQGYCTPYEKKFRHVNGELTPIICGGGRFDDEAGLGVLFAVDLTEKQRLDDELRNLNKIFKDTSLRLETIINSVPVGLWIADPDGCMVHLNEEAKRIWGGEAPIASSVKEYDAYEVWHADTGERLAVEQMPLARALLGERVIELPLDFRRFDGTMGTQLVSAAPILSSDGTITGAVAIVQDITRLKQIEETLIESEKKYRELFNSIDEGFCILEVLFDEHGKPVDYRCLEANPSFKKHTGLIGVIGKTALEMIPERKDLQGRETYARVAQTRQAIRCEMYSGYLNRWFDLYVCPHGRPDQRQVALLFSDITQRKKNEEELKAFNEKLERMVERRTQELQEAQAHLLHAEKLSAIGRLSASIAHEFNNPLQGVMTILKGFQKTLALDEQDRIFLDLAFSECDRMKNLIRTLQDFNRPSSGRKVFTDIHATIDSLMLLSKSDLKRKGISTVLKFDKALPNIIAVPDQIKQVLLNLLQNAADACQEANGVITIKTFREDDRIAVAIQDNGIGIAPDNLTQIFQPFFTTKPEVKGTGLGLSICHGIVQNHQGDIRVSSEPGKGSTFTVLLPISYGEYSKLSGCDCPPVLGSAMTPSKF